MLEARLDKRAPRGFGLREVVVENLCGLVLLLLLILTIIGLLALAGTIHGAAMGNPDIFKEDSTNSVVPMLTFQVLLTVGAGAYLYFLPLFAANPYIRVLVASRHREVAYGAAVYCCQVRLSPRIHGGLWSELEDADDVGWLEIAEEGVIFIGDHVDIVLPYEAINDLVETSCGPRGLWVLGCRVRLFTEALDGVEYVEFLERASNTARTSRQVSREIARSIEQGIQRLREESVSRQ